MLPARSLVAIIDIPRNACPCEEVGELVHGGEEAGLLKVIENELVNRCHVARRSSHFCRGLDCRAGAVAKWLFSGGGGGGGALGTIPTF